MGIDLIVLLIAVWAVYQGYQRGLILAVFAFLATLLGVMLAFKFSSLVAGWLGERVSVSDQWLPIVAFLAILIGVILLIRLGAKALEGMVELAQLGLLNRLGGVFLYLGLYLGLASAVFYLLQWTSVVPANAWQESWFLKEVQPLFMRGFKGVGVWIPWFREQFDALNQYFASAASAAPPK